MKSKDKVIAELRAENEKMKNTMEYLWKLEYINSGQYGYSVRSNTAQYLDEKIISQYLNDLKDKRL